MDLRQRQLFDALPSLSVLTAHVGKCKLCYSDALLFDIVDFNKHCSADPYRYGFSGISVTYYRCTRCSFIFTDLIDDWSAEEVAKYIYNADYVKVDPEYTGARATRTAVEMIRLLKGCEQLRILDYGSGSGVFSEQMRNGGFPYVESYDPFSSPNQPSGVFDIITCFEVMEHSPRPLDTFADMASRLGTDGAIIVGQSLQPSNIRELGASWWYVAPRNGHVSIFAEESFITLANAANMIYHRGEGIYVFGRANPSSLIERMVTRIGPAVHLLSLRAPDQSLTSSMWNDVERTGLRGFRWSAEAQLIWPSLQLRSGITIIQIPFLMEVCPGFAAQCAVHVDGRKYAVRIEREALLADIQLSQAKLSDVKLITPAPLTPMELRGVPDQRHLGLAVAV